LKHKYVKIGHMWPHIVYNFRTDNESGRIKHQRRSHVARGPRSWHACFDGSALWTLTSILWEIKTLSAFGNTVLR